MPLGWPDLLAELRRADLLVAAPEQGPTPSGLSADNGGLPEKLSNAARREAKSVGAVVHPRRVGCPPGSWPPGPAGR